MKWIVVAVVAEAVAILVLGVAVIHLWNQPMEDTTARHDVKVVQTTLDAQGVTLAKSAREARPYQRWTSIMCREVGTDKNKQILAAYKDDLAATFLRYLVETCRIAAVPAKAPSP